MTNPELSVIILCYRSEEDIIPFSEHVKQAVSSFCDNYEIVLVGNYIEGSNDRTKAIVENIAAKDHVFRAICKPKKGMMGWDMREGLEFAKGELLCVIDGDGQFPVSTLKDCYEYMSQGNYDLIKTYRSIRQDGFKRRLISYVYNVMFKVLFPKVKSKDINSKPKLLKRSLYERLNLESDDWFIDAEIMIKAARIDASWYEFPIEFKALEGRASFVKTAAIIEFMRNLLIYRFKRKL